MPLSENQKRVYIERHGAVCPHCASYDIETSGFDCGTLTQDVTCLVCDAEWRDCYTLSAVKSI